MNKLKCSIMVIGLIVAVSGIQYYFTKDKVVIKYVEVEKIIEVVNRDIEIIETKDGKKITKIKERIDKQTDKNVQKSKEIIPVNKKSWFISTSVSLTESNPIYTLNVQRRILFNVHGGVYARTDGELGVSIGINF